MCPLRYFRGNHLMHTGASVMYTEIPDWTEHIILSKNRILFWVLYDSKCPQKCLHSLIQTCKNNVVMLTWHAKPFEDETDVKEHSKTQNEKQVIESFQHNGPVNLSAQVQDVNKTCGLICHASILLVSCFKRLFESTIKITVQAKRQVGKMLLTFKLCRSVGAWSSSI